MQFAAGGGGHVAETAGLEVNFVFKIMEFVFKMMEFVFKMTDRKVESPFFSARRPTHKAAGGAASGWQ